MPCGSSPDSTARSFRARSLAAGALAAAVSAAPPPAAAQVAGFEETLEVRVVEVEVVVTDRDGRPVRGLGREDFELRVGGRPVEIAYFSAVEDGRPVGGGGERQPRAEDPARPPAGPFLAVVRDARTLGAAEGREAISQLRARLDALLAGTRGVLVARQGRRISIAPGFSRDRETVDRRLAELAEDRTPVLEMGSRRLLLRQLEHTRPSLGGFALGNQGDDEENQIADRARRFLQEIHGQAEIERHETELGLDQLRSLVRSMAVLPGRKAILYLGAGIRSHPGEALYRAWWDKFKVVSDRLGIASIESEIVRRDLTRPMIDLVAEANRLGVTLYTFDAGGLVVDEASTEFRTASVTRSLAQEAFLERQNLVSLASATGGLGRVNSSDLGALVGEMLDGFATYYSLGFEPTAAQGEEAKIAVRLRRQGLEARHFDRFPMAAPRRQLEASALAALLTDEAPNPLGVQVELGDPVVQRDGTVLLPVLVKVPIARLTLVPREDLHEGRLSLVVVAQDGDGELSDPVRGEAPLTIANADLLAALSTLAGVRLELKIGGGEQRLALAVRDEIADRDAILRLAVALPGKG